MKFITNSRQLHKILAPWIFLPLLISALTGLFYRISKDILGFSRDEVHWLMSLHEGEWLGENGELIYVILNSLGLIWMIFSGLGILSKKLVSLKRFLKVMLRVKI